MAHGTISIQYQSKAVLCSKPCLASIKNFPATATLLYNKHSKQKFNQRQKREREKEQAWPQKRMEEIQEHIFQILNKYNFTN